MGTLPHVWRGCSSECLFSLQKISFLCHDETSPGATSSCSPSSCPCGFFWIENIHPPCSHSLNTGVLWWGASQDSLSSSLITFVISLECSPVCPCISWTEMTRTGHCTPGVAQRALCRMGLSHLFYFCQYHPCRCSPGLHFLFLLQWCTADSYRVRLDRSVKEQK